MHRLKLIICSLALALAASPLVAQSASSTIDIHGFGGWAYGKTDGHKYSLGTEGGEYDNAEFALNVSAKPIEKLSIVAQVRLESGNDQEQAELDYAFAEWAFNDALRVRAGRVKHPFGIYGEVFDVDRLEPIPRVVRGTATMEGEGKRHGIIQTYAELNALSTRFRPQRPHVWPYIA